jgi:hypothetical protein
MPRWLSLPLFFTLAVLVGGVSGEEVGSRSQHVAAATDRDLIVEYCLDCHNADDKAGGLAFDMLLSAPLEAHTDRWEKVVRRLRRREMPPPTANRPDDAAYEGALDSLEVKLDDIAQKRPNPGRTATLRRLNRTQYQNAIRDLLAIEIDVDEMLPKDDAGHGFDNVTVSNLSPTLLDHYLSAAQKISRLAVGRAGRGPGGDTFRMPADRTQEAHVEGLPLGTRGGLVIDYVFPQEGEYQVQMRLTRDRNEEVEGLKQPHDVLVLLDKDEVARLTVKPPTDGKDYEHVDAHLKVRFAATAGPHKIGVTFLKNPSSLLETKRQPYQAHFNMHRHPRISPAIYQVSVTGPFDSTGPGDTESRRRIFIKRPTGPGDEGECARAILSSLMRRAYRRPIDEADLEKPMQLFQQGAAQGGFEAGVEMALCGVLINPNFLFHIERDPAGVPAATSYRISDVELASRLSFFLWSSIPDDELLDLAMRGELSKPEMLEVQVRRMLQNGRSRSLATNFAAQWLHLRNLESITPDLRLFPDFDDNLRQAFRRETELLFQSIVEEDRNALDLLRADYTFLNERLAKHYGIPHIYGSRFRRVELAPEMKRGGLLRQGSILMVTSYATRTSPVLRGKWVLDNLLGSPPSPPPDNVPALKDNTVSGALSVRARLAEHRANAACAVCHDAIDPIGFSLENYDAVGRWRTLEEGKPVDATGGLPDGSTFDGVDGLEQALLDRPDVFLHTLVEKLLTFALGRGIEPYDAPAVRHIVREAGRHDYRFSALILEIAKSTPFQMRRSE